MVVTSFDEAIRNQYTFAFWCGGLAEEKPWSSSQRPSTHARFFSRAVLQGALAQCAALHRSYDPIKFCHLQDPRAHRSQVQQ